MKPLLQLHTVFYLLGAEFAGHYWHTLFTEIDLELQTHFPLYSTSFLPQTIVHTPFIFVYPALHIHCVPFQIELTGHYEH